LELAENKLAKFPSLERLALTETFDARNSNYPKGLLKACKIAGINLTGEEQFW
jgi:hypothetical protein